jgi:two-component system sensor histidine kinase/response regulator
MEQDRRSCLDAGMNDFLVKPIDPEHMGTMLVRWVPARRNAAPHGVPAGIDGLDTALGLSRMMNKTPLYIAMLRRYAAGQREVGSEIRGALGNGEVAAAARIARTARMVSGNVGATAAQDRAAALELALNEGRDAAEIECLLSALDGVMGPLVAALDAQLPAG